MIPPQRAYLLNSGESMDIGDRTITGTFTFAELTDTVQSLLAAP